MLRTFGQELYFNETVRVAEVVAACGGSDRALRRTIADGLPLASARTRATVAASLLRRLGAGSSSCARTDFARLIAVSRDCQVQRDLVYYCTAKADAVIGVLARELLYPVFIDGVSPKGVDDAEFRTRNGSSLFQLEPSITHAFAVRYARNRLSFTSARTVTLSLRIMRQSGIVLATSHGVGLRRGLVYTLAPHGLSLAVFLWCLYDEFAGDPAPLTPDRIERSTFARTLVVPPLVIAARLREAHAQGFVSWTTDWTRHVKLTVACDGLGARLCKLTNCR